ncbi:MAG: hypothetical protein JNJ47_03540, partial [Alphaproteobacteria bacterium]|nr:hypothetical protein [Alphaproteobacteria bacterium]
HSFYAEHIAGRNLWVGIEYMTPESRTWWTQRLGYDAYMHFGKQINFEHERLQGMSEEERTQMEDNQRAFAENMSSSGAPFQLNFDPLPRYVYEAQEFASLRFGTGIDEAFMKLYFEKGPELPTAQNDDYLSAWRGFQYNLNNNLEAPTWIAYVSSQPVEGPLYEKVPVTSPEIKMAMTLKIGQSFYSPLGIYKSPIATAFDEGQHRNLSMMMHAGVARFVGQIQPKVQHMVVRPLTSMSSIFDKSGLPFSKSTGVKQISAERPYVRCTTPIPHRWYDAPEVLSAEEKEKYGDSPYIIVDPAGEYYQISGDHWFAKSPFLGGVSRDKLQTFPFVTASREELGKL